MTTPDTNFQPDAPVDDLGTRYRQLWSVLSPEALGKGLPRDYYYFSAVCYYYGVTLYRKLNVFH